MTAEASGPRWGRARVIWNPGAGRKGGVPINAVTAERIEELAARAGVDADVREAKSPADARRLAHEAVEAGDELVVAAGGDGTVGTIANELLGHETALGILPLGSVMNVPRSLGLPRDLDEAADVLATGEVRSIDVGEVRGRPFYEAGSVGLNAAMFREVAGVDSGDWLSLVRTIWVAFRYRPRRMEITLDDRRLRTRGLMVSVANGPYTGVGLTVAPEARLDDGKFDIVLFRRFSKVQLLRHLASIAFGRHRYTPETEVFRSSRVAIEGRHPLPCRADSHDLGTTPIEFVVRPRALRVVVPAGAAGAAVD